MFKREKIYHDDVHLHPQTTVRSYTLWFWRYGKHKILKAKVTMARSNQGQNMTLPTYTP